MQGRLEEERAWRHLVAGKDEEQCWHALGSGAHGSGHQLYSMWFFSVELETVETASGVASGKLMSV